MNIKIPTILVAVDLGEYAEVLRGQFFYVWANPPLDVLNLHTRILTEKAETMGADLLNWYAVVWSQGAEDTRWTGDELRKLEERDPALVGWMISETWRVRKEHLDHTKKG